jgi:hypothetical protein
MKNATVQKVFSIVWQDNVHLYHIYFVYMYSTLFAGYLSCLSHLYNTTFPSWGKQFNSFLINYVCFVIDSMKEDRNILCICCFEACHKPISILKCQCSIHKCIINSECIRYQLSVVWSRHSTYKVTVKLLKGVCIEVSNPLGRYPSM